MRSRKHADSRPLTLAVDIHGFSRIRQGSRTFVESLYREIPKIDESIRVISFGQCEPPEFPVAKHVGVDLGSPLKRLTFGARMALAGEKVDYAHYQYFCPVFPVGRSVITVHDILPVTHPEYFKGSFAKRFRLMLRASLRLASHVNTVSEFTRRAIASHFGIDERRIAVVPNGVASSPSFEKNRDEAQSIVAGRFGIRDYALSVSRIEKRKNIPLLIDAVKALNATGFPDLSTVLLGSVDDATGNQCERTREAIESGQVIHLQSLSDEDKLLVIKAAQMLVFPSMAEGFGIPPLEAMAAGVPVVVADQTAHGEIYRDTAVMVSGFSTPELAEKMRGLLTDKSLREKFIRQGSSLATAYTWRNSAAAFLESLRNNAISSQGMHRKDICD